MGSSGKILDTENVSTGVTTMWKTVSKTNWAVSLCLVGFVISVFAFLNGSKVGLAGMGASAAGMFMGLALARFAMWMAVFGLIGSLVAGLVSILAKRKAISEIIGGVQNIRDRFPHSEGEIVEELNKYQSKNTKKIVALEKAKQKLKSIVKGT